MIKKELKVVAIPSDYWACGQYRIIQPYRDLALRYNPLSKFDFKLCLPNENTRVSIDLLKDFDVIVFQRIISEEQLNFVKHLKNMNKIIIQEIDDNLFEVDTENPFHKAMKGKKYKEIFKQSLKFCDYIHTTTDSLKDVFVNLCKVEESKVIVFPNAMDLNHPLLQDSNTRRNELPSDKVIFGWQGGSSHSRDLKFINFVSDILDTFENSSFAFCSNIQLFNQNFSYLTRKYKERIINIEPVTTHFDYFPSIPSLFDIGLAPLKINKFNNGKSYLKCLEYGVWGVPTICSPSSDYIKFNKENDLDQDLLIQNNDDRKEWVEKISNLIKDNDKRLLLNNKIKEIVKEKYSLKEVNKLRFNFYVDIYNKMQGKK